MRNDSIVSEIRRLRNEYASKFDHDLAAICKDLRELHRETGRPMVRRQPVRLVGSQQSNGHLVTEQDAEHDRELPR